MLWQVYQEGRKLILSFIEVCSALTGAGAYLKNVCPACAGMINDRHLSMEQLAADAHVDVQAVRSLYDGGLASLRDTRRVFAVLGIHVHSYPVEMVTMSL